MLKSFFALFCLPLVLWANWSVNHYEATIFGGEPSSIIDGCVNAITGDFLINQNDLVVRGYVPLPIQRRYFMRGAENPDDPRGGWRFFDEHMFAYYYIEQIGPAAWAAQFNVPEKVGVSLVYQVESDFSGKKKEHVFHCVSDVGGLTNCYAGKIGAHLNLRNNRVYVKREDVKELIVEGPDGSVRTYRTKYPLSIMRDPKNMGVIRYDLIRERLPSGNLIEYHWQKLPKKYLKTPRLEMVKIQSPAGHMLSSFTVEYQDFHEHICPVILRASDGRKLTYILDKTIKHGGKHYHLLKETHFPDSPSEVYWPPWGSETAGIYLSWIKKPEGRTTRISQYQLGENENSVYISKKKAHSDARYKQVKCIYKPLGETADLEKSSQMIYFPGKYRKTPGHTDVLDAEGNLTRYHYNKNFLLTSIQHFLQNDELFSEEHFHWTDLNWLRGKTLLGGDEKPLFALSYTYDSKGNIEIESHSGHLSGQSLSHFSKPTEETDQIHRSYYPNNLIKTPISHQKDHSMNYSESSSIKTNL